MILGNVIRIMNADEVLINLGNRDKVKEGMEFVIYKMDKQKLIIDPKSKEKLGPLETIKGKIVVTRVQEKFSRAKSLPLDTKFAQAANAFAAKTRPNIPTPNGKINVDPASFVPLDEDFIVAIGDPIRVYEKPDPCKKK